MTAMSGFVQPAGAYLLTDAAGMNANHVVTQIGSKVVDLPDQRMAIAWSGYVEIADFEAGVSAAGDSQSNIFAALPAIARGIAASNHDVGLRDGVPTPRFDLLIALWNAAASRPELWAIHSTSDLFGPQYRPFTPARLAQCTALPPETQAATFGRTPNYADPASFDARRDGLALLEAERRLPYPGGHYAVGGYAQLTSVTASGVSVEVLRHWPDKIGCPIDPFA